MNGRVELGRRVLAKGNVKRALEILDEAANDDSDACRALADLYEDGTLVKGDARKVRRFRIRARDMEKQARARERRAARAFREERRTFTAPCRLPSALRLSLALAAREERRKEHAFKRRNLLWRPNAQMRRRIEVASVRVLSAFMPVKQVDGRNFHRLVACL